MRHFTRFVMPVMIAYYYLVGYYYNTRLVYIFNFRKKKKKKRNFKFETSFVYFYSDKIACSVDKFV